MKKRLNLASYGVQEITLAEAQEINGGLSEIARKIVEHLGYVFNVSREVCPRVDAGNFGGTNWNCGMRSII
jgi:hypothetical protein